MDRKDEVCTNSGKIQSIGSFVVIFSYGIISPAIPELVSVITEAAFQDVPAAAAVTIRSPFALAPTASGAPVC